MIIFATLLSSALFGLNTPEAERQEILKSFFNPPPNDIVKVSVDDLKDANRSDLKKMRGFINVSPPKNTCFVVTRDQKTPGDYICKKTSLAFDLTDIDRHGKLTWEVKTSPDDIGTKVFWQTPYRTIIAVPKSRNEPVITKEKNPDDFWQSEPPKYLMIESCNDISNEYSRRIELKLFNGESWRFYFPFKHRLLPQPDEISNLEIANSSAKRSLSDAAKDKKQEPPKEASKSEAPAEKKVEAVVKDEKPNNYEDRKSWTISLRNSYEMSSENFHANNTNISGDRGRCRYNFLGPEEDPKTGRIECQNTSEYHMLLIPTTCLDAVKGDKDHP
jgi:hypothetical protein